MRWLFTSTTPTGQDTAKLVFKHIQHAQFCYMPYDFPWLWRRFFRQMKPQFGLLVETELWPNLLATAHARQVPVALVNARVSPKTAKGLERFACLSQPALKRLVGIVAQTESDAEVLQGLGGQVAAVVGNMKFDVRPQADLLAQGRVWRESVLADASKATSTAFEHVLLAASTREGEEALILAAWQEKYHLFPNTVLMLVPRHPQRFDEVQGLIAEHGFQAMLRSKGWHVGSLGDDHGDHPDFHHESSVDKPWVLLGDSMGEMPAYYAMADAALMGGSWLPFGGQNLIEACACGCPVALGPHTYNFEKAADDAINSGAALRFETVAQAIEALTLTLTLTLGAGSELARWRDAAVKYAAQHRGATERTAQALQSLRVLEARR